MSSVQFLMAGWWVESQLYPADSLHQPNLPASSWIQYIPLDQLYLRAFSWILYLPLNQLYIPASSWIHTLDQIHLPASSWIHTARSIISSGLLLDTYCEINFTFWPHLGYISLDQLYLPAFSWIHTSRSMIPSDLLLDTYCTSRSIISSGLLICTLYKPLDQLYLPAPSGYLLLDQLYLPASSWIHTARLIIPSSLLMGTYR